MASRTIEEWVRILDEDYIRWMWPDELVPLHTDLHQQFGSAPHDAIIPGEQRLSNRMRSLGFEHRHKDALSDTAGTTVENPAEPTIDELRYYLERNITLMSSAVALVQDTEGGSFYLRVKDEILGENLAKSLLKMVNRWMPPGVKLKKLPTSPVGEFAKVYPTHSLQLCPDYMPREVTLWSVITTTIRESAAKATTVFKRDADPRINVKVIKSDPNAFGAPEDGNDDWLYVLGEVLVPGEPDRTKTNPDGSETGADADIYDDVEVDKACLWFGSNSQRFELMHAAVGGAPLDGTEIQVAKNWTQYGATEINGRAISPGTWLLGAYVRGGVRAMVEDGTLNTWSISASAMAAFEEAN